MIFDVKKFMEIDESNNLKLLKEKLLSIFNCQKYIKIEQ